MGDQNSGGWFVDSMGNIQRLPQAPWRKAPPLPAEMTQAFQALGDDFQQGYRQSAGGQPLDPMFVPRIAGDMVGVMASPLMAAAAPIARALPQPSLFTWDPRRPYRPAEGGLFGAPKRLDRRR
jgi:hypothetical protein